MRLLYREMRLLYREKGGMSLITIAILVLHLLAPAHAGSLKDAQDDIKAFRKDKATFTPRPEIIGPQGRWIATVK